MEKPKHRKIKELRAKLASLERTSAAKGTGAKRSRTFEEIRRSLRKQRGGSKPQPPQQSSPKPAAPIVYRRDLPRHSRSPASYGEPAQTSSERVLLEDAVEGIESQHPDHGLAYLIATRVDELPEAQHLAAAFRKGRCLRQGPWLARLAPEGDEPFTPEDLVFMDIETTGLSNSPLFLIGVMIWADGGFEVRQFLARNYAEEAAVVAFFTDVCAEKRLLVTFNGKSFDMPYIRTRAAANGIAFGHVGPLHLDLLHESRRIWKKWLPDCKLQTLETRICGRRRHGDIPGAQIPDAYHAYVRTENAWQVVEILKHNLLDLVTLADIMVHMPGATKHTES